MGLEFLIPNSQFLISQPTLRPALRVISDWGWSRSSDSRVSGNFRTRPSGTAAEASELPEALALDAGYPQVRRRLIFHDVDEGAAKHDLRPVRRDLNVLQLLQTFDEIEIRQRANVVVDVRDAVGRDQEMPNPCDT